MSFPFDPFLVDLDDLDRWKELGLIREDEWAELNAALTAPDPSAEPYSPLVRELIGGIGTPPWNPLLVPWSPVGEGELRFSAAFEPNGTGPTDRWGRLRLRLAESFQFHLVAARFPAETRWNSRYRRVEEFQNFRVRTGALEWRSSRGPFRGVLGDFSVDVGAGLILNTGRYRRRVGVRSNQTRTPRERGLAASARWAEGHLGGLLSQRWESAPLTGSGDRRVPARVRIANGVRIRRLGLFGARRFGSVEAGATILGSHRAASSAPIAVTDRGSRGSGSVFIRIHRRGSQTTVEVAHAGGWAARLELRRTLRRFRGFLQVDRVGAKFASPTGSVGAYRRRVFVRGALRLAGSWWAGGQLDSRSRVDGTVSLRQWVWIRGALLRKIRAGWAVRRSYSDLWYATHTGGTSFWIGGSRSLAWPLMWEVRATLEEDRSQHWSLRLQHQGREWAVGLRLQAERQNNKMWTTPTARADILLLPKRGMRIRLVFNYAESRPHQWELRTVWDYGWGW